MKIEIVSPATCPICGKQYGKSNTMLYAMEVWIACGCQSSDKIYLINTNSLEYRLAQVQRFLEPISKEPKKLKRVK